MEHLDLREHLESWTSSFFFGQFHKNQYSSLPVPGAGYGLGPLPSTHWRRPQLLDEVPVRTLIEVTLPLVARSQAEQVLPIGADCAEEAHLEEEDGVCGVTVLPDAVDLAITRALS